MSESSFFFHLLRISIAQLLAAHGFNKTNDRALDVLADLYVRHLQLVLQTTLKYTELRNEVAPSIQDITRAFDELKIISPAKLFDPYDMDKLTLKGIENFEAWFQNDTNNRYREISRPNLEFIKERLRAKKFKDVNNKMNTLTAALGQQSQQAQQLNPTLPYQPSPSTYNSQVNLYQFHQTHSQQQQGEEDKKQEKEEDLTVDDYWIEYLIRQLLNEKPELKFKGTVFVDYVPEDKVPKKKLKPCHDFMIVGPTPENLMDHLPYMGSEGENSSDDESDDRENTVSSSDENDDDGGNNGNDRHENNNYGQDNVMNDFDYYEHQDLDLYGDGTNDTGSNNLSLF